MNAYVYIAAIILAGVGVYLYLWRKDKAEAAPRPPREDTPPRPPPPPRAKHCPQPPSSPQAKPPSSKRAEQDFLEALSGVRFSPISSKPFRMRAEACLLRDKKTGGEEPGFRIDVSGGIEVAVESIVDLVVTMEDVSDGSSQPVYATMEKYQDDQTGQFVLRSTLGKVSSPGRPDSGWTSVGVVPLANIRAPKSGKRTLRLSCAAVPAELAGLTVIDERLRAGMLAAATTQLDVMLVRKGYVEQRYARQNAAGLVVCLGYAFAGRLRRDPTQPGLVIKAWMRRYLEQLKGEDVRLVAQAQASLEAAVVMCRGTWPELGVACRELLAYEVAGMPQEALALCVEVGRVDGAVSSEVMAELKGLCRELSLGLEELRRHIDAANEGADRDQEHAELVGVDLGWDARRIRRHLLDQFTKWNSRHPKDAAERAIITRQLEAIAKLRQRYL